MTPDELVGKTEHSHQRALFAWANAAQRYGLLWALDIRCYNLNTRPTCAFVYGPSYEIPQLEWLHAIHNQGHGDAIRGGKAKAEGVKAGVSDIFLPCVVDHHAGLYIELKVGKNKVVKGSDQHRFLDYANAQGYLACECHGYYEARNTIARYLLPTIGDEHETGKETAHGFNSPGGYGLR